MSSPFSSIPEAIEEIKAGRILIVIDDEDRENEGDFIMAAEWTTPAAINFMARYGRGLICLPTTRERLEELKVPAMVGEEVNTALLGTRFTVSVDAVNGTTSGISAADRAETVQVFVRPDSKPDDLARPGHIFPSAGLRWRRAAASRPYRGDRRSDAAGRALSRGRAL